MKSAKITVELMDGRTLTGRMVMRDVSRYEDVAKKQKPPWGTVSENPARWESFVSWAALTRAGAWDGTYEAYVDEVAAIDFDFEDIRPTNGASSVTG